MTHISLPFKTHAGKAGNQTAFQIVQTTADGLTIPIGLLHDHGAPLNVQHLSNNIAALLNGHKPLHIIPSQKSMLFARHKGGIDFHFKGKKGVSTPRAHLILLPDTSVDIDALIETPAFNEFMGAVQKPKRIRKLKPKAQGLQS